MNCSKYTDIVCPIHGECTCEKFPKTNGPAYDKEDCPLHSAGSNHPDSIAMQMCEDKVQKWANSQNMKLTDHDKKTVAQFVLFLEEIQIPKAVN